MLLGTQDKGCIFSGMGQLVWANRNAATELKGWRNITIFERHKWSNFMAEQQTEYYSIEDYLALEAQAEERHEYEAGRIQAMSGGSIHHSLIGTNITNSLYNKLEGSSCLVLNGDARLWIDHAHSFVYPDAMVICGKIQAAEEDPNAVVNPVLIVEVLSKSTVGYDRGDKFHKYCSLPSFQEYLLIDQDKPVVDVLFREEPGYWKVTTAIGLDQSISLASLGFDIPLSAIYRNVQDLGEPIF
jgi:Uma2 family endonuclease